ncbi:NAD(P)-dependent alcohol dehydrogenase [Cyclobacterium amurskyense]|uniref:Alcohol dehydrogenase zinc-binding domain protein n=1 Tax=Cyclobacterium amurskyense TaxID=320787 RepID=A0A0H4PJF4_9BACT|nr:NAD(P)-dependent alcohol dehydrogenase [Cyclobacterium amurskyense]AKP53180.1 Alcohol dehydrogenase zinc-binding domain protein [Cyclobacterium amurskyense]
MMKAIISTGYGSAEVLQVQEVPKPIPKENEVLIKVYAASVTRAGSMMRTGKPYIGRLFLGLLKPKNPIPGTGFAGVVEAIGNGVRTFKVDDRVFGESLENYGTQAEYLCLPEGGIITTLPNNMTFEEAAPVCDGALTSINFLKELAEIKPGKKVLINGASGSLGTSAVQLAKYYGAEVTGICSTQNIEMVKSLGADHVIDYTKQNFSKNGQKYDIIYDTIGKLSFSACKSSLTEKGMYVSPVLEMPLLFQMLRTSIFGSKKAKFSATGLKPVAELKLLFNEVKEIIETGKLKSIIDKSYPLEQVGNAHRYIDKGHKRGNVVLVMEHKPHKLPKAKPQLNNSESV